MAKPKCPQCGSTNVVPSLAKNSHDNCVACGYSDFVAKFYEDKPVFLSQRFDQLRATDLTVDDPSPAAALEHVTRRSREFKSTSRPIQGNPRKPYWWEKD